MSVRCVAPHPTATWPQNFGAWQDEIDDLGLPLARSWSGATVHLDGSDPISLDREYVQLSTPDLQRRLLSQAAAVGVHLEAGQVAAVDAGEAAYSRATLSDGRELAARLIVDATGHGTGFLERTGTHAPAWQIAYGQRLHMVGGHPWPVDRAGFMDFRIPDPAAALWRQGPPTFLYVLPLDAETVFVEETTLIARPAPDLGWLAARLAARLAWLGLSPGAATVTEEERCRIRMLGAEPVLGQRTLGFGASAGMVHPATGYLLPRVLRAAPVVADALAAALGRDGATPQAAAAAGWSALWPAERRRQWALYRFGATVLCDLDGAQIQDFFGAYFALPPAQWRGFLSATQPAAGLARTMAMMFSLATPSLRRRLMQAGTSRSGVSLLRELVHA